MLVSWLLATMLLLAPARDHQTFAVAMVNVLAAHPPLFKNDPTKQKTASLLVAVNFREGSLLPHVKGDKDRAGNFTSFCSMQIHLPFGAKTLEGWTGEDLVADPEKCVTVGLRMLRESMQMCPKFPVAFYASGPGACGNTRAQRISNDRMFLAARLVKEVRWAEEDVLAESPVRSVSPGVHAPGLLGSPSR